MIVHDNSRRDNNDVENSMMDLQQQRTAASREREGQLRLEVPALGAGQMGPNGWI
jgi:hypothetical protein